MDLGSILIGLTFLTICILPFLAMYYSSVKKNKKALQSLNNFAVKHECTITKHESCGDFSIGMDENRNMVFFTKKTEDDETNSFIDLHQIQMCHSNIVMTPSNLISRIELNFTYHSKQPQTKLEFYNEDINTIISGEPVLCKNWSEIINDKIKKII